jgi:tyrosyl-tRNA synthetase
MSSFLQDLKWRGMVQDIMPGTEEQFNKEITAAYIGFDPTADSLHIGSLVPILLLVHLQNAGHKPIALVGGATGMVGDPSGKSQERNLLSEETLNFNLAGVKKQLQQYLNFDAALPNAAEITNNYDWFKSFTFLDFIRDVGKYITVNYMMAKDSVKKRLNGENGLSFTEFTYQLVQGFDFYWLYQNKNCKVQMGGSDQWGNIVTGTELIRKKLGAEAFAFTCPLIKKADGGKFGKTEQGNIWLDPQKTTPYQFYQFWLNANDADAENWIKIFTFLSKETINSLVAEHNQNPAARILQKTLAKEITIFVHGLSAYETAIATTSKLFNTQNAPAESLTETDLQNLEGVVKINVDKRFIEANQDLVSFLAQIEILPSKGEARKMLQGGGISVNRKKVADVNFTLSTELLLHNKYMLVQKGKKNYYLVTFE